MSSRVERVQILSPESSGYKNVHPEKSGQWESKGIGSAHLSVCRYTNITRTCRQRAKAILPFAREVALLEEVPAPLVEAVSPQLMHGCMCDQCGPETLIIRVDAGSLVASPAAPIFSKNRIMACLEEVRIVYFRLYSKCRCRCGRANKYYCT